MKCVWIVALALAACENNGGDATPGAASSTTSMVASSTAAANAETAGASAALVTAPWTDTKAVMDTSLDAPNFQCAPKVFTRQDTITLRAEVPHGGWLVVAQPDSTIMTLTSPIHRDTDRFAHLVDPEAFKTMLILRFRADVRAKPDVYGRDTLEPVFRLPGEYVFTIGENLGTEYDEEDPNWHCTIRLSASP